MKVCLSVSGLLLVLTFVTPNSSSKTWLGIVPLRSTRADIEKLWGKPRTPPANGMHAYELNENRSIYFTEEGKIYVLYARFTNCHSGVSPDAVLWVSVEPKNKTLLRDLKIEESKFVTYDPAYPPGIGYTAFEDAAEGYTILTYEGVVEQIYYQPTSADRKLCPDYFEDGKVIPFRIHTHVE